MQSVHLALFSGATSVRMINTSTLIMFYILGEPMLNGTLIVIASDHGGWRNTHDFQFQPFSALIDIPLLIRGEWPTVFHRATLVLVSKL